MSIGNAISSLLVAFIMFRWNQCILLTASSGSALFFSTFFCVSVFNMLIAMVSKSGFSRKRCILIYIVYFSVKSPSILILLYVLHIQYTVNTSTCAIGDASSLNTNKFKRQWNRWQKNGVGSTLRNRDLNYFQLIFSTGSGFMSLQNVISLWYVCFVFLL